MDPDDASDLVWDGLSGDWAYGFTLHDVSFQVGGVFYDSAIPERDSIDTPGVIIHSVDEMTVHWDPGGTFIVDMGPAPAVEHIEVEPSKEKPLRRRVHRGRS